MTRCPPSRTGRACRSRRRPRASVEATADQFWSVSTGIGGSNGWYSWRLGWWGRGLLDRLFGGPGLRRGRRDPVDLSVDSSSMPTTRAGRCSGSGPSSTPRGLAGHAYWAAVYPLHGVVFGGRQRDIARATQHRPRDP
ncbi:MAG: DUF2867 domain-containing protein [Frankiaceae bacterium]